MSSLLEGEVTLPVDFDGSANPAHLGEVTLGVSTVSPPSLSSAADTPTSNASSSNNNDTSGGTTMSMVQKQATGRMSPVRARTMKEYDTQLAELKKENFSLKLRIYFLEERMQQKFDGDGENVFKTNIELKVEVESLKKELADKQELLKKARSAVESVTAQRQSELDHVRDDAIKSATDPLQQQLQHQQQLNQQLQAMLEDRQNAVEKGRHQIEENNERLRELTEAHKQLQLHNQQMEQQMNAMPTHQDLEELQDQLEQKDEQLEQQGEAYQQLMEEMNRLREQIASGNSERAGGMEENVRDSMDRVSRLEEQAGQLADHLTAKEDMIGQLEDIIRDRDRMIKDAERQLADIEKVNKTHEENALKRDKVIQGLASALHKREKELTAVTDQLEAQSQQLSEAKETAHRAHMQQYSGVDAHLAKLAAKEEEIADLQLSLNHAQAENQRLQKVAERRNEEVNRLRQQLDKAEQESRTQQDAMQEQWEKQQKDRAAAADREKAIAQHYQGVLDDRERELATQEKLVQRLSRSLQERDEQLTQQLTDQLTNQPHATLIQSLRQQLLDKDKQVEAAVAEKFSALEERDADLRHLKLALREKETDIDKANHMLLTTEETIDSLEGAGKEKEQQIAQLTSQLQAQQGAMQEAYENHQRALEGKENLVQKLKAALESNDRRSATPTSQSATQQGSCMSGEVEQLTAQLAERDTLLRELLAERDIANTEQQQLSSKLKQKDIEIKSLAESHVEEVHQLNEQAQQMQSEINKKDYELQRLDNRNNWEQEQQQEMCDKLRAALQEKDKTIEALVGSAREKDRLFRQLQVSSPVVGESVSASQLAELTQLKDQVATLNNQLANKNALVERLRSAMERRSPKPDSVPRQRLQDTEEMLNERTQACLEDELEQRDREDDEDLATLQAELTRLRHQVEIPAHTVTVDDTLLQLVRALQAERDIYITLNANEQHCDLDSVLVEIERLRKQMEESVAQNQQQQQRHQQGDGSADDDADISDLRALVDSQQTQLEELRRWNASLQARLSHPQPRPGTVGGSNGSNGTSTQTGQVGGGFTPHHQVDRSTGSGEHGADGADGGLAPHEQRTGGVGGSAYDPVTSTANNTFADGQISYLPSFYSLPGGDSMLNDDTIAHMSRDELTELVHQLRNDLLHAQEELENQQQRLSSSINNQAQSTEQLNPSHLQQQLDTLQKEHQAIIEKNAKLQHELDSILHGSNSDADTRIIPLLKQRLAEAENANIELIQKLQARLDRSDNAVDLPDLNSRDSGERANPELILQMAGEIERLKQELKEYRIVSGSSLDDLAAGKKQRPKSANTMGESARSKIPRLERSNSAGSARHLPGLSLTEHKQLSYKQLFGKLASTEATVRQQADKIRYYRGLLDDAGIVPRCPVRSRSETNLKDLRGVSPPIPGGSPKRQLPPRPRSQPPRTSSLDRQLPQRPRSQPAQGMSSYDNTDSNNSNHRPVHKPPAPPRGGTAGDRESGDTGTTLLLGEALESPRLAEYGESSDPAVLKQHVEEMKEHLAHYKHLLHNYKSESSQEHPPPMNGSVTVLRSCLAGVAAHMEELLHKDQDGDIDLMDITPAKVEELKTQLAEARNVLEKVHRRNSQGSASGSPSPLNHPSSEEFELLHQQHAQATQRVAQLEAQLHVQQQQSSSSALNHDTAKEQHKSQSTHKTSTLNKELQASQNKVTALEQELSLAQQRGSDLQQEKSTMQEKITMLEQLKEGLQHVNEELLHEKQQLEQGLIHGEQTALDRDRPLGDTGTMQQYPPATLDDERSLDNLQQHPRTLDSKKSERTLDGSNFQHSASSAATLGNHNLPALQASELQQKLEGEQAENATARLQIKHLKEELSKSQKENANLKTKMNEYTQESERLLSSNDQLLSEVQSLESECQTHTEQLKEMADLQRDCHLLNEQLKDMDALRKEAKEAKKKAKKLEGVQQECTQLKEQLKEFVTLQRDFNQLKEQQNNFDSYQRECDQMREQLQNFEALKRECAKLKEQLKEMPKLNKEKDKHHKKLAQVLEAGEKFKKDNAKNCEQIEIMENICAKLQRKNDKLQNLLDEMSESQLEKTDLDTQEKDLLTKAQKKLDEQKQALVVQEQRLQREQEALAREEKRLQDLLTKARKELAEEKEVLQGDEERLQEVQDNLNQKQENFKEEQRTLIESSRRVHSLQESLAKEQAEMSTERAKFAKDQKRLQRELESVAEKKQNLQKLITGLRAEKGANMHEEQDSTMSSSTATATEEMQEKLQESEDSNQQLSALLTENQATARELRDVVYRLNTEIEEKDGTIQKLRRRLKHLQKKYKDVTGGGTASPTSATLTSDDGDVMTQQQEHEDFMTPGQAASYGDVMVMRDGDNGGSSSFSSKSKQQHDTSANITLRRRQGAEDIVDSATNGDVSSNSRSFKSSVASVERGRHAAPEGSANRSGIPIDDFFNTSIHSESSSTHKQFTSTTSQQKSSSSSSEQQQPKHSSEIISHLRQQLQASNELNEALRRELEIYEALKLSPLSPQEDSNDIEGGPSSETTTTTTTSYHHTTTSNSSTSVHQNHPQQQPLTTTTSTSSVSSSKEQAGSTDSGLAGMTLEEHLVEIRALRLRLEESLRNNSKLRASLEERLREESSAVLADMYIQLSEKESEVERLGDELRRQGLIAEKQHQQQLSEVHRLKIELRQSEQNAARKDAKLMAINVELERREKELKATLKELKSVRNEKAVLQEQMCEEEEMNKTLKLELSVYDRLSNEHNTSIKSSKSSRSTGKDTTGKDSTGKDKGKDAAGTDLSMLMQEIRELRKQLERTIENNNLLRNKLEEQLTMANKGYFQWQQHHQQHQQQQQQTSSHTSASANSSMISQASTGHHEKKSSKASKRRPKPEQDLHDRPTEVIEPPTRDFDQLSKGSAASFSSLKSIESKEEEFCSPRQSSSWRGRGKEFSAAELSTEFVTKSQNVSDIEAMREAEWNSGLETPQIWDGELPVVTETSLFAGSTTSSISSIMRRSKLLESDTVAEKEQNGQKAHIGDVQVLKDVTSTINLHHTHHQHSSSLVSSLGSGLSRSNENRLNAEADEEDDMIASSRHSPAPRPASNLGSRYNVTDPRRPPGSDLTTAELSNGHDQATVHMRIGSDLRCLYAVGELDDHELLGKQLAESSTILSTLHNTIKHRLVEAKPQSNEYSTLRSLAVAVEQLNTLLTEQRRLTQLFWLQQLPDAGDNTAAEKQQQLEKDILRLKHKYARCKADLKAANSQLALNNARKEGYEQEIIKQLSEHHVVLQQAAINMARRNAAGSGSNPSSTTSSQH